MLNCIEVATAGVDVPEVEEASDSTVEGRAVAAAVTLSASSSL